jgi:hypothetical protein
MSPIKLLLLGLIIYGGWHLWRSVSRYGVARRQAAEREAPQAQPLQVEDMVQCRTCNTYVTASGGGCGRPDCPRRG